MLDYTPLHHRAGNTGNRLYFYDNGYLLSANVRVTTNFTHFLASTPKPGDDHY